MPWATDTLGALIQQAETRIVAALDLTSPVVSHSVARILARVHAAARFSFAGYLAWIAKQIFASTCDADTLLTMAALDGQTPNAQTFATYTASTTGTLLTVIPAGSGWKTSAGVEFTNEIAGSVGSALALKATIAGAVSNIPAGTVLTPSPAISGVTNATTSTGVDGSEAEDPDTTFRARYIEFLRTEVLGGHVSEYIAWAKSVPGVTRVWLRKDRRGAGSIDLLFVRGRDASLIPSAAEVEEVAEFVATKQPATADVMVLAPVQQAVDFTITGVPGATARAAATAELADLFYRVSEPSTGYIEHIEGDDIRAAVRRAWAFTDISPSGSIYPSGYGYLLTLGTITWA